LFIARRIQLVTLAVRYAIPALYPFREDVADELRSEQVQNWLKRHKRFKLHFIPTSSSWLNLVERFFALITQDAIRRGVFKSVAELETAITA
jgi:hypothetical protein